MANGTNPWRMVNISIISVKFWSVIMAFAVLLSKAEGAEQRTEPPAHLTTEQQSSQLEGNSEVRHPKTINDARFDYVSKSMTSEWKMLKDKEWEKFNLSDCWGTGENPTFKKPGLFYSTTFGYTIAEKKTYQEYAFPEGKYWKKPEELERSCLCTRATSYIQPPLSYSVLNRTVVYMRATGTRNRLFWKWNETAEGVKRHNPDNMLTETMTYYKMMAIKLFDTYASVRASCSQYKSLSKDVWGHVPVDWEKKRIIYCSYVGRNFYHCIACDFRGEGIAFEPVTTDLVIQELDELSSGLAKLPTTEWPGNTTMGILTMYYWTTGLPQLAPSVNVWGNTVEMPGFSDRTKWIEPAYHKTHMRDGNPVLKHGQLPIYLSHPSMSESDLECKKRVAKDRSCYSPVGGLHIKLAFWQHVHYDPAGNQPRFPGHPIQLRGNGRSEMGGDDQKNMTTNSERRRVKRQIWDLAVMVFGIASSNSLKKEFNDKIDKLTTQLNARFKEDEDNLQKLANKLNALSRMNVIQAEKLNTVILEMMKNERIRDAQIRFLETEVDQNKAMLLRELDTFLYEVQTMGSMTLSQLAVDHLIMEDLKNRTAKPLFDETKAYLVRIKRGTVFLREHAQLLRAYEEEYNTTRMTEVQEAEEMRRNLNKTEEEEGYRVRIWGEKLNKTILINTTGWCYSNISVDPMNITFGEDFFKTLGVVTQEGIGTVGNILKEGASAVGGIFGAGIGAIFAPLLKFLIPVAMVIAGLILCCCLIQHHPSCDKTREALPRYFQMGSSTGEEKAKEAIKHHSLKKFMKTTAEGVALATI